MTRGEIWWVDYGIPYGSEPGYRRPVIILQNDFFNNSKINTTIGVPLSTNVLLADVPGNIFLNKKDSKLTRDSVILISQIGVIDKERLLKKVSKINREIMEKIENNIKAGPTAHNRSICVPALKRLQGSVRLGHSATLHSHGSLYPHFCSPGLATQALIRAAKTSHTAGTLYDIPPKIN
jgi:mRNA interferase MazF